MVRVSGRFRLEPLDLGFGLDLECREVAQQSKYIIGISNS